MTELNFNLLVIHDGRSVNYGINRTVSKLKQSVQSGCPFCEMILQEISFMSDHCDEADEVVIDCEERRIVDTEWIVHLKEG
jgi:hypothetical protein